MSRLAKIILAVIVTLLVFLLSSYVIYTYTGWHSFSMKKGENFQLVGIDSTKAGNLRFKKCTFRIKGADGNLKAVNVSSVLNGMAKAYEGNGNKQYIFKLSDPGLNTYSFQIPNFNDSDNKPKPPENWDPDSTLTDATLVGYYKLLN